MNDVPRQKLCELIATYGRSLCDDSRRCEGLLRDLCGEHRREIHVLVSALKERVAIDLVSSSASRLPHEVLLRRLTKRLRDNLGLAEDAARWAVDSWALALGVIASVQREAKAVDRQLPTHNKQRDGKNDKTAIAQPSSDPNSPTVNAEERLGLSGVRVIDRRVGSRLSAEPERESQPSGGKPGHTAPGTDEPSGSTKSGGVLGIIVEIVVVIFFIPLILFGVTALLFGSAIIACLPFVLVFRAVGINYDKVGGAVQVLLSLLILGLTVVVAGLLLGVLDSGWNVLKGKLQKTYVFGPIIEICKKVF
jgi:hypothetical protein